MTKVQPPGTKGGSISIGEREELRKLISDIQSANSSQAQAEAVLRFHQTLNRLHEKVPELNGYEFWPFNDNGTLLLPDENDKGVKYVVVMDLKNHPALFLPFLIKLESRKSWEILRLPL
jgi:hypothetical protein